MSYRAVRVSASREGWGGPLVIEPTDEKNKIVSVTGGGIHPVARHIAERTGGKAVDGFSTSVPEEEMACVVIDCGGTARVGVYPKRRIPTLNLSPIGPSGPLAEFIEEDIYVSGVSEETIRTVSEDGPHGDQAESSEGEQPQRELEPRGEVASTEEGRFESITRAGRQLGDFMQVFYQSGRDTVDQTVNNVLPFLVFVSVIAGVVNYEPVAPALVSVVEPVLTTLPGLVGLSVVMALPVLSPVLGPGAVLGQVLSVVIGVFIATGSIPPQYALPILFAINPQVGCDFAPVGLSMTEAESETVSVGVPAILWSRLITGPVATVIAFYVGGWIF